MLEAGGKRVIIKSSAIGASQAWHYAQGGIFSLYELLPAFIVSSVFIVVVSLLTKAPEKEITEEFEEVKTLKE